MQARTLASGVSLTSAAAQASVTNDTTPYIRNRAVVARVILNGNTGTPTVKIQQSDDGSTWTDDIIVTSASAPVVEAQLTLKKYTRANVTATGSAGTFSAYLEASA